MAGGGNCMSSLKLLISGMSIGIVQVEIVHDIRRMMMKNTRVLALSLSVLVGFGLIGSAFAGERGKIVNNRQVRQEKRIEQGVRSGQLTRKEAFHLQQSQRRIDRYEKIARADGRINPQEARKLDRMQDRQNKVIYNQKHDKQERHHDHH